MSILVELRKFTILFVHLQYTSYSLNLQLVRSAHLANAILAIIRRARKCQSPVTTVIRFSFYSVHSSEGLQAFSSLQPPYLCSIVYEGACWLMWVVLQSVFMR